jgi:hypothetical protein
MEPCESFPRYGFSSEQQVVSSSTLLPPTSFEDENIEEDKMSDSEEDMERDDSDDDGSQSNCKGDNDDDDSDDNGFDVENDEYLSFVRSVFFDDGASEKSGTDGDEDEEYDPRTDPTAGHDDDLDINDEYYHVTRKEVHDLVDASIHALARNPEASDRSGMTHRQRSDLPPTQSGSGQRVGDISNASSSGGKFSSLRQTACSASSSGIHAPRQHGPYPRPSEPSTSSILLSNGGISGIAGAVGNILSSAYDSSGTASTCFPLGDSHGNMTATSAAPSLPNSSAITGQSGQLPFSVLSVPGHSRGKITTDNGSGDHAQTSNDSAAAASSSAASIVAASIAAENEKKLEELQKKNRLLSILVSKMFSGAGEKQ